MIDEDGKINASTEGIKGEICLKELEELLGNNENIQSISKTDEYYQQQTITQKQIIKNKNQ